MRNPFSGTLDIAAIPDDVLDEFLDLRNDSSATFMKKNLTVIRCSVCQSHPEVSEIALRVFLLFSTTYFIYVTGFSALQINIRCALLITASLQINTYL